MDVEENKSLILYYGREKFYQLMQNQSILALTKFAGNKCFRMYNGFALVLGNRIQEGIRELGPLQSEKDITMGVLLGLNYAHKRCTVVDKEALLAIDTRMREERKHLSANSAYYAAVFLFMSGKVEKSRDYADKALKINPNLLDAVVLKGWCNLCLQSKAAQSTLDLFDVGLSKGMNIDACLGQVKYHQINNDFDTAISVLIKLSVRYPDLNIPLIEKMKTQLANWSWDHAMETAARILNLEPTNIEALRIKSLILFCRDGNTAAGLHTLKQLFEAMAKVEGSNCDLYLNIGAMFARVCGRNADVVNCTTMFIEKAAQMSPGNADYITELGFQAVLLNRYKEATKYFRTASKLDDSSIDALCGLTQCQLAETGPTDQVRQQIEFLNEVQGPNKTPILLFISAKMKTTSVDATISQLIQACEIQFKNLKTTPYGTEYLRKFDPDFLLQITHELMQYSPVQSNVGGTDANTLSKQSIHISLKHSLNILEAICKACPGLVVAVFQLARVQFMCSEISDAAKTLQRILTELDPTYTDAHLLIAQIHLQNSHFDRAAQSLDVCLSHNFNVRDSPMYHLLNGIINKNQQQHMVAIKSFLSALSISDAGSNSAKMPSLGMSDKVTLLLEMVDTYVTLNQHADASKVMASAIEEFSRTPEEGRLVLANAEMHLQQGKVSTAIELLKQIQPGEPYYIQTKTKLADIYLHRQKNRLEFTRCFKELVDEAPGSQSYLMLGNAHMAIQEPDEAIDAFKQAHRLNPNDSFLASKLGRAYVKTHQYTKAINYYKEATRYTENSALKLDLAELYLKLKQFSNAEEILLKDIENISSENEDLSVLQAKTKQLLLLARIRERSGNLVSSMDTLREARENQYRLQKRTSLEQNVGSQEQNTILSNICMSMSEHANNVRNFSQAIEHCKEALKYTPDDSSAMTLLARLYTQTNNTAECFRMCERILQLDANNEAASVMMADMSFRNMEFSNAAYHFSQLLLAQPTYWTALTRLIEVMRRSATLHEAVPFLNKAEQSVSNPSAEAGLNYCKGLYDWYNGNPNGALRYFNNARQDVEWGKQSIFNMIDICLNPDGDLPNELSSSDQADDPEQSRGMALKTAQRLLNELRPKPGGLDNEALNHKLLTCFLVLAGRQRSAIELTLNDLTNIAARDEYRDLVGPVYAIASAHILLKQSQRARNHLKRVANNEWQFEDAEYLERCWLLLADLYIQSGKYDMASDLLAKVLKHNRSSCKAYELQGFVAEKNHVYALAAEKYGLAWRLGVNTKPLIGYKLAFSHMKCKNYANAIDVCQQVMKLHPDYVSIKSDILDKCRHNLRS